MTATLIQSPDRVVLQNISWQTYQSLLKDFSAEPAIRLTYDRGSLEIRMPLDPHESYRKLLGRLIEAATEGLDLEIRSLGSRTCDREDLQKGLEPDQCYYIQNEARVRDVEQIDLALFPPPDLAVEVDITSSSLDRFSIYTALGIPEIWRYDGRSLSIYALSKGHYSVCDHSLALPLLSAIVITDVRELRFPKQEAQTALSENSVIRQFRQWLRSR
ncbi:Uma2 family endonuclease [Romeria aff. gracilis LEGE 07310]|uniref:Uma2 family endonuclease n=1 Tax=Vasconcelosia minhoensis LEGE 07310 TaxID=915328 RepID=A0A8J7DNL2_9CYAN|nr:Uma2 family endonuclease [Romeria gracilis]MBE9078260.1 Uma2 family endonuclease [Romeria aff. gracilis LEGE 07310]